MTDLFFTQDAKAVCGTTIPAGHRHAFAAAAPGGTKTVSVPELTSLTTRWGMQEDNLGAEDWEPFDAQVNVTSAGGNLSFRLVAVRYTSACGLGQIQNGPTESGTGLVVTTFPAMNPGGRAADDSYQLRMAVANDHMMNALNFSVALDADTWSESPAGEEEPPPEGQAETTVHVTAEAAGETERSGAADTTVEVSSEADGQRAIEAEGQADTAVHVSAEAVGQTERSGAAEAAVEVSAEADGQRLLEAEGDAETTVHVSAEATGAAVRSGAAETTVHVSCEAAGGRGGDPDNFQAVVDGFDVQLSWDPSPMVPV